MTNFVKVTTFFCLAALLCGCSSKSKNNIKGFYMLSAERKPAAATVAKRTELTLVVDKFAIAEGFASTSLIYRNEKGLYETDYYRRFFTDKGAMLSNITAQWLTDSGIFKLVATSKAGVCGDYRIKGLINEMYADMNNPGNFFAKLKIQIFIIDKYGKVAFSNIYNMKAPIETATADAVINATNECLKQYLTALETDISNTPMP